MDMDSNINEKFVVFKIDGKAYGVPISDVQIIEKVKGVVRVPKAPSCVTGVINLRGDILPVINIRKLFELEEVTNTDSSRTIILKVKDNLVGIVVDSVSEVNEINNIDKSKNNQTDAYVYGVGRINDGKIVTILNTEAIIGGAFLVNK